MDADVDKFKETIKNQEKKQVSEELKIECKTVWNKFLLDKGFLCKNDIIFMSTLKYLYQTSLGIRAKGMIFIGKQGTGKTTALQTIKKYSNNVYKRDSIDMRYDFYTCNNFTERYMRDKENFREDFNIYQNLCIDELGQESDIVDYGMKVNLMKTLIEKRYDNYIYNGQKTVISTMLSKEKIVERYGEHIWSRLCEMCELVDARGDDLRQESKEVF